MRQTPPVLWQPSEQFKRATTMHRFLSWCRDERGLPADPDDYHASWRWSVDDLEGFWTAVAVFFDVRWERRAERVLEARGEFGAGPARSAAGRGHPQTGAQWFPDGRVSYAEHVFRGTSKTDDAPAIHHASELRELSTWTWGDLRRETARIQGALRAAGVRSGDRVVGYLPNIPEAVAAFLAVAGLGAVWSSCSPDFGARSVIDRFAQIEPKVLLCVDGYSYGGKRFDRAETIAALRAAMPTLERTVTLGYLDPDGGDWDAFLATDDGAGLRFAPLAFDHPLWVLYSSGTTGLPKAIVHGQGGILLEHLKHLGLHADARPGERLFWFTTTGWMMWNFIVGALLPGAEIVLYDGNPGHPDLSVLWDLAERTRLHTFGTSAAFIASCMKAGVEPRGDGRALAELRALGSTGSPLSPEGFQWVYDQLGADTWLFSTSGGTDVCTAFVGGCPLLPVYRGELQAAALGCKLEAFDEDGNSVTNEVGELVLTEPMPSMPVFFWNDPDGERYRESYFELYPGVWRHGDWIEITDRGTAVIYGRSDSTINRGGIRMGTSEIYRAVLGVDEVVDALVVDVDGWMPLFVVLREGAELDDALIKRLARRIREDCSPRHVPNEVFQIREIPRTLSGKVLEVPVKRILLGTPSERAASRDSLANPAALDFFVQLAADRAATTA